MWSSVIPRLFTWALAAVSIQLETSHASTDLFSPASEFGDTSQDLLETGWKWGESCFSHKTCDKCDTGLGCHWCGDSCHAKGSIRGGGCLEGTSCNETKTCYDHTDCAECSDSSWSCHWCDSDKSCHEIGSRHGCLAGTNCYAIERCQRLEPERIYDGGIFSSSSFNGVGAVSTSVLWVLFGLVLCCSTMCYGTATFLKGAVDDLVGEPEFVDDGIFEGRQLELDDNDQLEIPLVQNKEACQNDEGWGTDHRRNNSRQNVNEDEKMDNDNENAVMNASKLFDMVDQASVSLSRATTRRQRPSSLKQMYRSCQFCYMFTILTSIILFIVGMAYAPRDPSINVCTNQVAWKDIVEGMASLKMSASFDLLISVYNPNRFEVDLTNGKGQLHHDGAYVGSFEIPEGVISKKAISDIVVKVTFSPDKWSALSLTSEYYRSKLKLTVSGHSHVKIPALGHYQFDAKFQDIEVDVNDPSLNDTHLCACPGWKKY